MTYSPSLRGSVAKVIESLLGQWLARVALLQQVAQTELLADEGTDSERDERRRAGRSIIEQLPDIALPLAGKPELTSQSTTGVGFEISSLVPCSLGQSD